MRMYLTLTIYIEFSDFCFHYLTIGTKMIAERLRFTTNLMKGRGRTPSKDQSDTLDSVIASISYQKNSIMNDIGRRAYGYVK